jgi:hypothetical protein
MPTPANYKQVLLHFEKLPEDVRKYFPTFKELVERYSWDVSIAYVFSRLERAKRETIYCGIVKLHWTESSLTRQLIDKDHMDRRRFRDLFKTVFGVPIEKHLLEKLAEGESVRDRVIHGKIWSDAEARTALISVLDFCAGFNEFVQKRAGFPPFGDLRGFKGRKEPLSKETTRWVLLGWEYQVSARVSLNMAVDTDALRQGAARRREISCTARPLATARRSLLR